VQNGSALRTAVVVARCDAGHHRWPWWEYVCQGRMRAGRSAGVAVAVAPNEERVGVGGASDPSRVTGVVRVVAPSRGAPHLTDRHDRLSADASSPERSRQSSAEKRRGSRANDSGFLLLDSRVDATQEGHMIVEERGLEELSEAAASPATPTL
jgi:hypothetical protein